MIRTGIRPKKITKKIQYPYSFIRLKVMSEKYKSKDKKKGLSEVNSLGMTRKQSLRFIQDIELTFNVDIPDSDLSSVGTLMSLGSVIAKKAKKNK